MIIVNLKMDHKNKLEVIKLNQNLNHQSYKIRIYHLLDSNLIITLTNISIFKSPQSLRNNITFNTHHIYIIKS